MSEHKNVTPSVSPRWLSWSQRLLALAQNGLHFASDPFDIERYEAIRQIAVEMASTHSGYDAEEILDLFRSEQGYATPKIDVRGAVFKHDTILLVRERATGRWTLPGGWADVGESPAEAVTREIWEESGFQTQAIKLAAVWDRSRQGHPPHAFYIYKLFFICRLLAGTPQPNLETDGVAFYSMNQLPQLDEKRVTEAQLQRMFKHHRLTHLATDFD